ncbi:MAG: PD40 domain-containing protein [Thermoflexales bacterium]|nr:PD40 domain-containing protein [Thermoflexales bacterium]
MRDGRVKTGIVSLIAALILTSVACAPQTIDSSIIGVTYYHASQPENIETGAFYYYDGLSKQSQPIMQPDQTVNAYARSIHWSPVAQRFVYTVGKIDPTTIFSADITGKVHEQLRPEGVAASGGYWSPDGRRIAFLQRGGVSSAQRPYVMKRDGTGVHPLFSDSAILGGGTMRWSPDGRWLAVIGASTAQPISRIGENEVTDIYVVDVDRSNNLSTRRRVRPHIHSLGHHRKAAGLHCSQRWKASSVCVGLIVRYSTSSWLS